MKLQARIAVLIALIVAMVIPLSASGATKLTLSAKVSRTSIAASGGRVSLRVTVRGAATCVFSSVPAIAGFGGTVKCGKGTLVRSGRLGLNRGNARTFHLKVVAKRAKTAEVARAAIRQSKAPSNKSTPATTIPPTPILAAHLDPSFAQNPNDPVDITFSYSASATATTGGVTVNNLPLPAGTLDLYVGGTLECSQNVGGNVSGGTCEVNPLSAGTYNVITEYNSNGVAPASETDSITIPLGKFSGALTVTQTYQGPTANTTSAIVSMTNGPPPYQNGPIVFSAAMVVNDNDTAWLSSTSSGLTNPSCTVDFVTAAASTCVKWAFGLQVSLSGQSSGPWVPLTSSEVFVTDQGYAEVLLQQSSSQVVNGNLVVTYSNS